MRTALTDAQWDIIARHCLGQESDPGRTGPDPRLFVEAVLWIARTGCPWRDLPDAFGKWTLSSSGSADGSRRTHSIACSRL